VTVPGGKEYRFEIDAFKKECLLKGLDNIGWTLSFEDKINEYEASRANVTPWQFAS
jgi:3-isopropylmalate/(R)-2-methylmalate dehydratase small subunit